MFKFDKITVIFDNKLSYIIPNMCTHPHTRYKNQSQKPETFKLFFSYTLYTNVTEPADSFLFKSTLASFIYNLWKIFQFQILFSHTYKIKYLTTLL